MTVESREENVTHSNQNDQYVIENDGLNNLGQLIGASASP